jgi:hypothetical protein
MVEQQRIVARRGRKLSKYNEALMAGTCFFVCGDEL